MLRANHRRLAAMCVAGIALVACGDDTGDDAADDGSDEPTCSPVGTELEADAVEVVEVDLEEYQFTPSDLAVPEGIVTFATSNTGEQYHELAFLPGGGDVPLTAEGEPDEEALAAAGAFELEGYAPNESCNATYELTAGTYTLFCIVEGPDGETHASKGMVGTLTVG